jgi:alpha-tubulin suppressor-like RCC1 family protein
VWGTNNCGQLGNDGNLSTRRSSPVQVPGTQWTTPITGCNFSGALKSDGTLWTWGENSSGQLGHGGITLRSSPIQVPGTQWNDVVMASTHTLARKTDGTLWSWGYNYHGELGTSNRIARESPVQIPGTNWNGLGINVNASFAKKTDGTLWSWGRNYFGQLGQNSAAALERSSPTQIPGTQWVEIDGVIGNRTVKARKSDGTLWAWGSNGSGQLGDNTTISKSSPVQVPGTQWKKIKQGMAIKEI